MDRPGEQLGPSPPIQTMRVIYVHVRVYVCEARCVCACVLCMDMLMYMCESVCAHKCACVMVYVHACGHVYVHVNLCTHNVHVWCACMWTCVSCPSTRLRICFCAHGLCCSLSWFSFGTGRVNRGELFSPSDGPSPGEGSRDHGSFSHQTLRLRAQGQKASKHP